MTIETDLAPNLSKASLESVVKTGILPNRRRRLPDHDRENRAIAAFYEMMAAAPETLLRRLATTSLEMCNAESAGVCMLESRGGEELCRWHAIAGKMAGVADFELAGDQCPCDLVLSSKSPQLFAYPERHFSSLKLEGYPFVELLMVPFPDQKTAAGALWVAVHTSRHRFDQEDARILSVLSRVASAVYQVTHSLQRTNVDIDAIRRLYRVGGNLVHECQVEQLLQGIVDTAIAIGGADFGDIRLFDSESRALKIVAQRNFPQWWVDYWNEVHAASGVDGLAKTLRERVSVEDVRQSTIFADPRDLGIHLKADVLAVQSIPLISQSGKALGVLSTHYQKPGRPDEQTVNLLDLLGCQAVELIDHIQTEGKIRRVEDRFRILVETTSAVTWSSNASGTWFNAHPSWIASIGLTEEEFHEKGWRSVVNPDDLTHALRHWEESLRGGVPFINEQRVRLYDGTWCWIEVHAVPIRDANGQVVEWVGMNFDITKRKRVEAALHEREARLQAILNSATDSILLVDKQGIVLSTNPATQRIFGHSPTELVGHNVASLFDFPFGDALEGFINGDRPAACNWSLGRDREGIGRRKDGQPFPVEYSISEIDSSRQYCILVRDITERLRLQRHLHNAASEEQRRLSCELHDGVQQELTGLSLLSGLVCKLTNELAAATQKYAAERPDEPPGFSSEIFRLLKEVTDRLAGRLAETCEHVHQLAHGISPVPPDADGLRMALAALAESVRPSIDCKFRSTGDVTLDDNNTASHVYRIAQESLNNALRHGKATAVEISLVEEAGNLVLQVKDNGVGFDPATNTHGMGRQTMDYRASMIGGRLKIDSQPQGGTSVFCAFPRRMSPSYAGGKPLGFFSSFFP